jgi:UDP-N-acetyl-D-galactosamine dehydrogenase
LPGYKKHKVIDIVRELKEYGIEAVVTDPVADAEEAKKEYNIEFLFQWMM